MRYEFKRKSRDMQTQHRTGWKHCSIHAANLPIYAHDQRQDRNNKDPLQRLQVL